MTHLRLRTQLFIATLLIICGLTGALLLIIRHTVSVETEQQVRDGTEKSVRALKACSGNASSNCLVPRRCSRIFRL